MGGYITLQPLVTLGERRNKKVVIVFENCSSERQSDSSVINYYCSYITLLCRPSIDLTRNKLNYNDL